MQRLYIIAESPDGPVKVGIARDPRGRLRALQTGNARPLTLAHVFNTDSPARVVERQVHRRLVAAHIHLEWFNVPVETAEAAVRAVIADPQGKGLAAFLAGLRLRLRLWWGGVGR